MDLTRYAAEQYLSKEFGLSETEAAGAVAVTLGSSGKVRSREALLEAALYEVKLTRKIQSCFKEFGYVGVSRSLDNN